MNNEKMAAERAYNDACCNAARELTIREHLNRQIDTAERQARAIIDLRDSLPASYLESGVSRILPIVGPIARA